MENRTGHWLRRPLGWAGALTLSLLAVGGCADNPSAPDGAGGETTTADARGGPGAQNAGQIYEFAPPVFDIAAAPNGNILVAETVFPVVPEGEGGTMSTIKEIRSTGPGGVRHVVDMTTRPGSPINGLAMLGARSFFATSGGKDTALAAGVWHVTPDGQRLIGDVEAFETAVDPDANEGPQWKIPACEASPPYSAGPQSNPYHLEQLRGGTALVADGAGNSLLEANMNGRLDWVAVFTPPTPTGQSSDNPADWMVLFPLGGDANCYVQPVPTAVAVGPDGGYYVGELTGVAPADIDPPEAGTPFASGLSRVWRIEPGARNVTCPSADCQQVLGGFTSILDVAFGPDGMLYVVEYDEANWFAATVAGAGSGGTINACDVNTGDCSVVEGGLTLPSAITFDKWGNLWLLENNLAVPTVRQVDLN